MPTAKPRITITLTENQHRLLRGLSQLSGQSMSSYVSEFLAVAEPTLERMAGTLQRIKQVDEQRRQQIVKQLEEAQTAFEPLMHAAVEHGDLFFDMMEEAATGVPPARGSARTERTVDAATPHANRGVTTQRPATRKPASGKAPIRFRAVKKTVKN